MKELGNISRSNFTSPTYNVQSINISDIVSQFINPNTMSSKSFSALQISIFNTGFSFPVVVVKNPVYDESTKGAMTGYEKVCAVIEGGKGDAKSAVGSETTYATQVSDEELRAHYEYRLADGQQRSSTIRLGTKYFFEDPKREDKAKDWSEGKNIPEDAGKEMLKYLAWRENFTIPCVVLEGFNEQQLMSVTVLMNQARGSHGLDSMKDIVSDLVNVCNMSEEWIAKNLFLDIESVRRMTQLSGMKSAFDNMNEADLSWDPYKDDSMKRKINTYLNREAGKYVKAYLEANPDCESGQNRDIGDIQEYAISLGWDREAAKKLKQSEVEIAPNGTRRESRIHNNYSAE